MSQGIHNSEFKILHYTIREVVPYINWIYYFHAWGMEPRFATIADIHNCPSCRASWVSTFPSEEQPKAREAMKLYDEATELLRQWADAPLCHAMFLLSRAYSDGDDLIVNNEIHIPLLRQQRAGKSGYTLCLSDFIREKYRESENENENSKHNTLNSTVINDIANTIGIFATTTTPFREDEKELSLQFSTLSDRLAEATAERMHEEVRKHYWGYAKDEHLTMRELHEEQFQGIRPAVGYPSLPDQSINFLINKILPLSEIGITLSENGAMSPHSSVSGLMLAHPKAHYFSIGKINEEQLIDYANRRHISLEQAKKFLAAIIDG